MSEQIFKKIPKQRRATAESVTVEPRHYDETQVDEAVTAELDEIDSVLEETEENAAEYLTAPDYMGDVLIQEIIADRLDTERYLARVGIAA